jgi:hypothetical protein
MARGIGSRVPMTSGQGVSRYSYQKGYALGNKGSGGMADFKVGTHSEPQRRGYSKSAGGGGSSSGEPETDELPMPPPKSDVPDKRKKAHQFPKGG